MLVAELPTGCCADTTSGAAGDADAAAGIDTQLAAWAAAAAAADAVASMASAAAAASLATPAAAACLAAVALVLNLAKRYSNDSWPCDSCAERQAEIEHLEIIARACLSQSNFGGFRVGCTEYAVVTVAASALDPPGSRLWPPFAAGDRYLLHVLTVPVCFSSI